MAESVDGRLIYKGFEAWIDVDDEPLPHFGVEHKAPTNEVSAWIPSEAGKRFRVYYRNTMRDKDGYHAELYLDGQAIGEGMYRNRLLHPKKMSRIIVSPTETRAFVFNHAALTDDDEFLDNPSSTSIGEIKLVLQLARVLDAPPKPIRFRDVKSNAQKIHERAKKGLMDQIQFSERQPVNYCPRFKLPIEMVGDPVTFIFKYRSLDMLQASGIAPRPTAPTEAESEDTGSPRPAQVSVEKTEEEDAKPELGLSHFLKQEDGDDEEDELVDDDDEDDEIVRRERALMAELEEVRNQKRARQETRRPARRVKTEPTLHFQPGEVVDLTKEPKKVQPRKRIKTEFTSRKFIHGAVIDLT